MSFRMMDLVLAASEPKGPKRWVLFLIAYRFNDDRRQAWPRVKGKDSMTEQLGYKDPAVVRAHLRALEQEGWITTTHRLGRASVYQINEAKLLQYTRHRVGEGHTPPPPRPDATHPPGAGHTPPPGGGIHPPRTEEEPTERHGSSGTSTEQRKSQYSPYTTPAWAAPGLECTLSWQHGGQPGQFLVRLALRPDGFFVFQHPRMPGTMLKAKDFWPKLRPIAAPQPQEATP